MSYIRFLKLLKKKMYPEVLRHLDMSLLRHWSKKISNAKNVLNKSGKKIYFQSEGMLKNFSYIEKK